MSISPATAQVPEVFLDKQVSCNGGQTWHDVNDNDSIVEGCLGFPECSTGVMVRYFAQSTDPVVNCVLQDTNTAVLPAPVPVVVSDTSNDLIFLTSPITCDQDQPGWFEPNTATLTCEDQSDQPVQLIAEDTADIECVQPSLEVMKECNQEVDPQSGNWIYTVTVVNTGTATLMDCEISDSTAFDCDRFPGQIPSLFPGESMEISCLSQFQRNTATATCTVASDCYEQVSDEDSAECSVDLLIDKQVSCDSGQTWQDVGYEDGLVEFCEGALLSTSIMTRYVAQSEGKLHNCALTDTNTALMSDTQSIPSPFEFQDELIWMTGPAQCDPGQLGWNEPNEAALSCSYWTAPGVSENISSSDTADIRCVNPLVVAKSSTMSSITATGAVPYTYTVTNTGIDQLTNVSLSDNNTDATPVCVPAQPATLDAQATMNCTAEHTVTQGEIDAGGNLTNTATATSDQTAPDTAVLNIPIVQSPSLTLEKLGALDMGVDGIATPGDLISYTFEVTNTGNITLTNVSVADPLVSPIICPSGNPIPTLAPGDSETCTGEYAITLADIDAGQVDNTATADSDETEPVSNSHTEEIERVADLVLTKTVEPAAVLLGELAAFTLTIENLGPATASDAEVTDTLPPGLIWISDTCGAGPPQGNDLIWAVGDAAPGATESCNVTVRVAFDLGLSELVNLATASSTASDPTPADASANASLAARAAEVPAVSHLGAVLLVLMVAAGAGLVLRLHS